MEYVLLVGIISLALFAMMQTMKRGAQSLIKTAADELSVQNRTDQFIQNASNVWVPDDERGYLDSSNTVVRSNTQKQVIEREGVTNYISDESQQMFTNSLTNMGFTEVEK